MGGKATILTARYDGATLRADPAPALPWWSFTKTLIAALCVRAAARGPLDLDAPCPGHAWTLRDLLRHRAGVGNYGGLPAYHAAVAAGEVPWVREDFLRAVPLDRPIGPPDAAFAYSNIGYMLAREALEAATGRDFGDLLDGLITPLGLASVRLAQEPDDFADLPFPSGGYHPGWVAHSCAMGTPGDAVRLLHALLHDPDLAQMQEVRPVGHAIDGRPWTKAGYGLGLMIGEVGLAGRALGHSGAGPFSVCAIYAFPDLPGALVTAAFMSGGNEAPAGQAALDLAKAAR